MKKILAISLVFTAISAHAEESVVINVPIQPVTASSLPQTVVTPTGTYIVIPDYRSGGVAAVVRTSGARK
jgi:hypothetical protein